MRKISLTSLTVLMTLALIISSCGSSSSESDQNRISMSGTIRYSPLEGGFFAIVGDDGTTYDPLNLEPSFQIDGLRVRMVAEIRSDLAGIHMVGPIIEIKSIHRE